MVRIDDSYGNFVISISHTRRDTTDTTNSDIHKKHI